MDGSSTIRDIRARRLGLPPRALLEPLAVVAVAAVEASALLRPTTGGIRLPVVAWLAVALLVLLAPVALTAEIRGLRRAHDRPTDPPGDPTGDPTADPTGDPTARPAPDPVDPRPGRPPVEQVIDLRTRAAGHPARGGQAEATPAAPAAAPHQPPPPSPSPSSPPSPSPSRPDSPHHRPIAPRRRPRSGRHRRGVAALSLAHPSTRAAIATALTGVVVLCSHATDPAWIGLLIVTGVYPTLVPVGSAPAYAGLATLVATLTLPAAFDRHPVDGAVRAVDHVVAIAVAGALACLLARAAGATRAARADRDARAAELAAQDIAGVRQELQWRLAHQATHDGLTGLPNRALLLERLEAIMRPPDDELRRAAVVICNLDGFTSVNDSFGRDQGDRVITTVAARLIGALRPTDTVARTDGDEFVVLCDELVRHSDALDVAGRLRAIIARPIDLGDSDIVLSVAIGVAFLRPSHHTAEDVLRDADAALHTAKRSGRGRVELFDDDMRRRAVTRLETEGALRRALARRELRLHYQPKIDVTTRRITGFEALLRWEHPDRGLLLPSEFIAVAEDTGLIVPMGLWALDQACCQLQRWNVSHPEAPQLSVAVNLSPRQMAEPDLAAAVQQVLDETGVDPARVELEITESALVADDAMVLLLRELKGIGVSLAVDDFGTGYSSLAYLRRLPVDTVKVDKTFVAGVGRGPSEDGEIVRLVVMLTQALGLQSVAEGVETDEQLAVLTTLGCHEVQGYLFSRPQPADQIDQLVARGDLSF